MSYQKKVIVLYAGPLGLGIIRSLGKKGIYSIVIYENEYEIGIYSKYCIEKVKVNSFLEKENILNALLENKGRWGGLLLIPGNDESILALSYYKNILEKYYAVYLTGFDVIEILLNKEKMLKIAAEARIPMPESYFPQSIKDIEIISKNVSYPCLLKPLERHLFYPIFNTKLFQVESYEDLKNKFELCKKNKLKVSIAEMIPGGDQNIFEYCFYMTKAGEITNEFVFGKIRQNPPLFGVTRVGKSTENSSIIPLGRAFVSEIKGFTGPAHIEFKRDERDGLHKFIEINGRVTLSVGLSTRCGINFPYILYSEYIDSKIIREETYEKDIYWINLSKDILTTLSGKEEMGFRDFIAPYLGKKIFAIESLNDPLPMISHWKINVFSLFKWIKRKMAGEM